MVTLSASRRNSGISSNGHSNTSSPRPSIATHQLPSLDENRATKVKFETVAVHGPLKNKNLKINNCERSDSGFSEVVEESFESKENGENHKIPPPELLKQKLEEISEKQSKHSSLIKIPHVKTGVVQERTKKLTEKYEKPKNLEKPKGILFANKKTSVTTKSVAKVHEVPPQKKIIETTKNDSKNMTTDQTPVRCNNYSPKKLVIQPNSKTALLRQKFENNCRDNEQPNVRNFRTK